LISVSVKVEVIKLASAKGIDATNIGLIHAKTKTIIVKLIKTSPTLKI